MIPMEEISRHLPQYLTAAAQKQLFDELRSFPKNLDQRIYTSRLDGERAIFQGDGLQDLLFVSFPNDKIGTANCVVLSNTCDVDPENRKPIENAVCYAPIISLEKYAGMISKRGLLSPDALNDHLEQLRKQCVTQAFFLPRGGRLSYEGLVLLDRTCHCASDWFDRESIPDRRLFTLSDYGAWLFLFKLSVHFTRIRDGVERGQNS